ncbi:MAG TPA: glycosyl hydrolase [Solirubrobacterales bacterium]
MRLSIALAGAVLALDLLWSVVEGSTGHLAYGLVDEPAHLATCAVALLALAALGGQLPTRFVAAALLASVAIDIDHAPQYLGWDALTAEAPRPYTHSPFVVGALLLCAWLAPGRWRGLLLGVAFGLGAHLLRDLATGPGLAVAWPVSGAAVKAPYPLYAIGVSALACLAALRWRRAGRPRLRRSPPTRARLGQGVAVIAVAIAMIGWAAPDQASASRVAVGVYLPESDWNPSLLDDYASAVGRQPAIVPIYRDWSSQPFEPTVLSSIAARGAVPMVTWEPWRDWSDGVSLWAIANGAEDAYIAEAARQAAAWGGPLFVRFAHEMNGDWYPWGGGVNGNSPLAYKAAWRHVVRVFRQEGAANVRWVWTPYVDNGGRPFGRFYPGDRFVDWVGFDGFNWGERSVSFAELFDRSYRTMTEMTAKPMIVAETGSIEAGRNKAIWIRRALTRALPRYEHVRALIWWSDVHQRGMDVRLDTSSVALEAWAVGLQARRFAAGPDFLLHTPPSLQGR